MGETIPSCSRGYSTWEVGSRPRGASPYGAMDMAGNVMEWVADAFGERGQGFGFTYSAAYLSARIDHIFHSGGIAARS